MYVEAPVLHEWASQHESPGKHVKKYIVLLFVTTFSQAGPDCQLYSDTYI